MQHGMTRFGILFPKGVDDHAHFALSKEAKGYWITEESLSHQALDPHESGGRMEDFHDSRSYI